MGSPCNSNDGGGEECGNDHNRGLLFIQMKENGDLYAVVLSGPGHRLYPLVDESSTTPFPKSLLPIANKPMLCHTIDFLIASGVSNISVVVDSRSASKLNHLINKSYNGISSVNIDMVIMEEHGGTVAVLQEVAGRCPDGANILLVPCDLCCNRDGLFSEMADQHRANRAMLTALFVPEQLMIQSVNASEEGDADEERGDAVLVAVDEKLPNCTELVYYCFKSDVESDGFLTLKTSQMMKHPKLSFRLDLIDVHCYIVAKELVNKSSAILSKPGMYSFREEALPKIVKSVAGCQCMILSSPQPEKYCLRANSVNSYLLANKTLAKGFTGQRVPPSTDIPPKAQVGADSLIGEHGRLGERSTVKRSVVGHHVIIGSNVKIVNSVILDNVVIEDAVKLDNCVIGPKAIIKEGSVLKACEVMSQFTVEPNTTAKGEVLGGSKELQNMFE